METQTIKVLIVDDDPALCDLLSEYLSKEGLIVRSVGDGETALSMLANTKEGFDILVLDIMMPKMSGIEVLQQLRPLSNIPVIMLTGRGDDIDRIIGLEMGADDYLGKPCNPRELLARIRAVLRRVPSSTFISKNESNTLAIHNIYLDKGSLTVQVNKNSLELTSAEFNVLLLLMQSAGTTLSKETLSEQALNRKLESYDRSIDVHISRLRQKLLKHGVDQVIKSVRGVGYQMLTMGDIDE